MKMKCQTCYRKIKNFTCNQCKCDGFFCTDCLPFFKHGCSYDYKKDKKEKLTVENVLVASDKIIHI